MNDLQDIERYFIKPENTSSKVSFGDIPIPISFNQSDVSIIGIPIDITTSFGKTTSFGPEAIRTTSAHQIETFIFEKDTEIFERCLPFDHGDLVLANDAMNKTKGSKNMNDISLFWDEFDTQISHICRKLLDLKKNPVLLGGEHTITYSIFKEFSRLNPLLIHFDAHRDMKPSYQGMEICHTTPFYHLINENYLKGPDLVQIGIRQADKNENAFAKKNDVTTFDAWKCHNSFTELLDWIHESTKERILYISFDIDVYDISYLPCTGTPEPFGLNPFQILKIIEAIDSSSELVGLDFVETGLKNDDYREGALATQTLLRILTNINLKTF